MDDPRVSDEATGLPPLEEIGTDPALIVLAWASGDGLVVGPHTDEPVAVRFLHLRGLIEAEPGSAHKVEWTQIHVAVPVEHAMDVALALGGPLSGRENINYTGDDPSVECAYPPCRNRLRRAEGGGPQWCSKEHRTLTDREGDADGTSN